jgi:hypothetical protein
VNCVWTTRSSAGYIVNRHFKFKKKEKSIMKRRWSWISPVMAAAVLATPLWAQRGLGIGNGSLSGAARGGVNGTISQPHGEIDTPRGPAGRGLGQSVDGTLNVTHNAELSSRLQTLLPTGTTVAKAAAGFEDQGEFIAAVHVAHNLNIPFDQLKAQMTGNNSVSLGRAIKNLRTDLDGKSVKSNLTLAERQTERDIQQAESADKHDRFATRITSIRSSRRSSRRFCPPAWRWPPPPPASRMKDSSSPRCMWRRISISRSSSSRIE